MVEASTAPDRMKQASQSPIPLRFLLLEKALSASEGGVKILQREWPDCEVRVVSTVVGFSVAFAHLKFGVAFVDDGSIEIGGTSALGLVGKICPEKPVIVFTEPVDEECVVDWLQEGANDLVVKQRPERLGASVRRAMKNSAEAKTELRPEDALREARARIEEQAALLDCAQDAILVQKVDGEISYWNHGARRLYGWSREEAVGRNTMDLIVTDREACLFARKQTCAHGEWRGELRHRTNEGREVVVQSSWTLVEDAEAKPKAFLVINTDVTENRLLEAKFLRSQRMESMGMMVGGIAHDLNNMLAPLLMSVDILQRSVEQPELEDMIGTMHKSAKNGAALVKQLLAFARGAEGKHVEVDLHPMLTEFVEFMGKTIKGNVSISISFLKPPPPVRADATQIKQVLMNLCINARDAMPTGGSIKITVDHAELDDNAAKLIPEAFPGSYVVTSVTDTGEGISPEMMERIFDPFFTTKDSTRGTGLGLATVRGIVKGHGGFITVESEANEGTTFRTYLPVDGARFNEVPSSTPFASGILLVDDEEMVRTTLTLLLKSEGYRVFAAESGEEALGILKSRAADIHLMISDLRMAGMDGCELISAVRNKGHTIPIIALTGSPVVKDKEQLAKLEARLLAKPMTRAILLEATQEALDIDKP